MNSFGWRKRLASRSRGWWERLYPWRTFGEDSAWACYRDRFKAGCWRTGHAWVVEEDVHCWDVGACAVIDRYRHCPVCEAWESLPLFSSGREDGSDG